MKNAKVSKRICVECGETVKEGKEHYGSGGSLSEHGTLPTTLMHGPCWEAWFERTRGRPPMFKGSRS